jgi:hypothetical protein
MAQILLNILTVVRTIVLFLVGTAICYVGGREYQCVQTGNPQSFECFMARGLSVRTDNKINFGFGVKSP